MENELEEIPGFDIVELVDADAELDDTDEGESEEDSEPSLIGTAPSAGGERSTDSGLAKELSDARAQLRMLQNERENGASEAQWRDRFGVIQRDFTSAKKEIFRLAKNDEDPDVFIEREMDRLITWRDGELGKYHGSREQSLRSQIAELNVPRYAESLATEFGLKKADVARIMEVAPNDMKMRAQGLKELRDMEKEISGNNRKAAVATTRGLSTGASGARNVRKIRAGSDEHLFALDPSLRP